MKKILFSLLIFGILVSSGCGGGSTPAPEASSVPVTSRDIDSEVIKTVANLSIGGMMCSEGCGGKIQKDIQALNGVKETRLDFEDTRDLNVVSVTFDPKLISEKELINCVHGIADGQYQVNSVELLRYNGLRTSGESGGGTDMESVDLGAAAQLLNLLQLVSQLAR
ncbi:MAG: Heavy-metal-associated domain [Bacteroidota bacterium]|jgi:copper chaperone CopZ